MSIQHVAGPARRSGPRRPERRLGGGRPRTARHYRAVTLAGLVIALVAVGSAPAHTGEVGEGDHSFIVVPTRLVFEGQTRSAVVTLINTGTVSSVYRVAFVHMRMSESGDIRPITSPVAGEAFADTLVRFAPRQLELGPRQSQAIRLQLRIPQNLPAGEYRSHLLVHEIPRAAAAGPVTELASAEGGELSVRIRPALGIAIPVIVREGPTTASVSISDIRFQTLRQGGDRATATLLIRREGDRSVYGDLTLVHVSDRGRRRVIGTARGIGIYTPNRQRVVQVALTPPPRGGWTDGRIIVRYGESVRHVAALAETSIIFP